VHQTLSKKHTKNCRILGAEPVRSPHGIRVKIKTAIERFLYFADKNSKALLHLAVGYIQKIKRKREIIFIPYVCDG
jgi:hypothetical protein